MRRFVLLAVAAVAMPACGGKATESASDERSVPGTLVMLAPGLGQSDISTQPTFIWASSDRAERYIFQLSTTSTFASLVYEGWEFAPAGGGVVSHSPAITLDYSTLYYWRVQAANSWGSTPAVDAPWSFTTVPISAVLPGSFTMLSPGSGATSVSAAPTLRWNASARAVSYRAQLSNVDDFSTLIEEQIGLSGTSWLPMTALTYSTIYYWRVYAVNDVGSTLASDAPRSFSTINANDAPLNTVPDAQATDENVPLVFSSGNGNQILISDGDADGGPVEVMLAATNGAMSLSDTTGLVFWVGDGTADVTMTFTGTTANVNAALNGLMFVPALNYSGAASLQVVTNDQGNTGSGGPLTDSDIVTISVNALNVAPVNTVPGAQVTGKGLPLVFSSGNGNQISISDLDAGGGAVQVTLAATNGTVTLAGGAVLAFSVGDGTADETMTLTGTITDINAALDGLMFTPTSGFSGAASLQIVTDDQGNAGAGGAASSSDTVAITVNTVSFDYLKSFNGPVNALVPTDDGSGKL